MLSIRVASVVLQRRCTLIPAQSPTSLMGVLGSCKGADHNLHLTLTSPQTPFVVIKRPASTFFSRSRKLNTLARLNSASAYRHHRVVNGYIAWFDSLSWVFVDFNHNGLANLTTRHDTISGPYKEGNLLPDTRYMQANRMPLRERDYIQYYVYYSIAISCLVLFPTFFHCLHIHFSHLQIRRMPCGRPTHLYQAKAASAAERKAWYAAKIWTVVS